MSKPVLRVARLVLALVILPGLAAGAEPRGSVTGRVFAEDEGPLAYAFVLVVGTEFGALASAQGEFVIRDVPPGVYTVKALKMGYQSRELPGVKVEAGRSRQLEFVLKPVVVSRLKEIVVEEQRSRIEKESSATRQSVRKEDLESLPVDTIKEAIALKAGIVLQAGELHFRGGRGNEVLYEIDGIPVRDPLGSRAVEVSTNAVAEAQAILGGFDAEHGGAQSGIVNITTREGGSRFSGEVAYSTDDYGAPNKTYDNFDRLEVGFGGPLGLPRLTYFLSFQGTFQDTYLKTSEKRPRRTVLDFIRLGARQNNDYHLQGKLALTPGPAYKLTLEYLNTQNRRDEYSHVFSLDGFVQTRVDTLDETGQILTRYGRFSSDREDSTFVPYSAAAHTPDIHESFDQIKAVWLHTLSPLTFYTLKLSRHHFGRVDQVEDKFPWEYEGRYPEQWRDEISSLTSPYFATNGDMPYYLDRRSTTWTLKGDWNSRLGEHRLKLGFQALYDDLALLSITDPQVISLDGNIGGARSQYHTYSPEGSFYVQDGWSHEGMVLNLGGRVDAFSARSQLDISERARANRFEFSPRLGIAYPISDRDVFSVHYGRFSQVPDRSAIFENRSSQVLTRGNPNLENQTTVSYQAGLQHQFAPHLFGQFSVYYKDIFGLLSVDQVSTGYDPERFNQYVNRDYASARGFELTLEKVFSRNFSFDLSYGYGIATGVASDPEQNRVDNLQYLPISEQPLDWDQRHTFSARLSVTNPDDWLGTAVWIFGSGFPFTPSPRSVRRVDPALRNSGRLPSTTRLDVQFEKHYRVWGQDLKLFIRGDNVLDARNIATLEPQRFPQPPGFPQNSYAVYYTETGRSGGAYLGGDLNGDRVEDWVPLNDPRVFSEGRGIRVGLGVKF